MRLWPDLLSSPETSPPQRGSHRSGPRLAGARQGLPRHGEVHNGRNPGKRARDSDFRVLEVLLHKGPLPVNVIGPKVNLTPGSISVAVDRLVAKGLVSRVECSEDRRVRIVALTARGKGVITPIFRAHAATMERVFAGLSSDELRQLEEKLK